MPSKDYTEIGTMTEYTISTSDGKEVVVAQVQKGRASYSGKIVSRDAGTEHSVGDWIAFDPDTLEEVN